MDWYHQFIHNAPDELNGFFATMVIPGPPFPEHLHKKQFCGIVWCYTGDLEKANEIFKPILAMKPLFDHLGPMPYPAIQQMFDGLLPPGLQWYWRADFFNELGTEVRNAHLKFGSKIPTPLSQMHLYPISGAAGRVAKDETPWAYRDAKYAGVIAEPGAKRVRRLRHARRIRQWRRQSSLAARAKTRQRFSASARLPVLVPVAGSGAAPIMKCNVCQRPMTALFLSYVCDYCDGLTDEGLVYDRGFVVWRPRPTPAHEYVFCTREDAEQWRAVQGLANYTVREVRTVSKFRWRKIRGA